MNMYNANNPTYMEIYYLAYMNKNYFFYHLFLLYLLLLQFNRVGENQTEIQLKNK